MIDRIELVCSFVRKDGACAGVEKRIVLENADCRLDRIEAGAAAGKNVVAGLERLLERLAMRFLFPASSSARSIVPAPPWITIPNFIAAIRIFAGH